MGTIGVILLAAFVIVCVLLVLLVIVQDDGESGMGGLLGGRGTAAFGSHSASVLTKATTVLVILFFVLALGLALINKKPKIQKDIGESVLTETTLETAADVTGDWWLEDDSSDEADDVDFDEGGESDVDDSDDYESEDEDYDDASAEDVE